MDCRQARQLFDAYLDGELPSRLATELGAHRVQCPECRRALALMEVAGHIVASDDEPVAIAPDFEQRLLACVDEPSSLWRWRLKQWANRRVLYVAGSLAAAAVVTLAAVGLFDNRTSRIAGEKDFDSEAVAAQPAMTEFDPLDEAALLEEQGEVDGSGELARLGEQARENVAKKRESVESLQDHWGLTITQILEAIEEAQDEAVDADHFPGADVPDPVPGEVDSDREEEDS